jgi:hypothetical protein
LAELAENLTHQIAETAAAWAGIGLWRGTACRHQLAQHFADIDASLATTRLLRTLTWHSQDVANPSRATTRHLTARLGQFLLLLRWLRRLGKLAQYIAKAASATLNILGAMCCAGDYGVEQDLWIKHGRHSFGFCRQRSRQLTSMAM